MSVYQIRTHYIFYSIIKRLFEGQNIEFGLADNRKKMSIFLPINVYIKSMDLSEKEDLNIILPHTIYGLIRLGLIDEDFKFGSKEACQKKYPQAETDGIIFIPTIFGIEFYLWVHGYPNINVLNFISKDIQFAKSEILTIPDGAATGFK